MTLADRCEVCGLDFGFADSGDGPAVLIMFPVGTIVVVGWIVTEMVLGWPALVNLALWAVMTFVLSIALLRPFKGVMVNLQYRTGARDSGERDSGERDSGEPDGGEPDRRDAP